MPEQTRKERIENSKKKVKTEVKKTRIEFTEKIKAVDKKKLLNDVKNHIMVNYKKLKQAIENFSKNLAKETAEKTAKLKKEVEIKKEEKKELEKQLEMEKRLEKEKESDFHCKTGGFIHQQTVEYGKGTNDFYFGGYVSNDTIAIVVENILGTRAYSSTYFVRIAEDTLFDLPGLYNDNTGEFRRVQMKVKKIELSNNAIQLEKIFS